MSTDSISPRVLELLRFTEAHNRHSEALARSTGENFNIFQILRVGHLEVTTHSPVLAELLNPKGNHGQGAVFLRLFLAQFDVHGFDAESETATIEMEVYAGLVTEKSGGRIDIVVQDGKGSTILIENKINAVDQDNQMVRCRDSDLKAHLFYLTLDGRQPSNLSEDELNRIQCKCISYDENILTWLKDCRNHAACLPVVRETITQYIHLIEALTHQSTTILMNKELIEEIIKTPESLRAFYTLREADVAVRTELIARLDAKLDEVAKITGLNKQGPLRELHKKESGFYFTTPGLRKCNLQIGFAFASGNYCNFYFGFKKIDDGPCPTEAQLISAFMERIGHTEQKAPWWPVWTYWQTPYDHWGPEVFEGIRSGQFAEALKAKLETLANIAKQICQDEVTSQKQ